MPFLVVNSRLDIIFLFASLPRALLIATSGHAWFRSATIRLIQFLFSFYVHILVGLSCK